MLTNFIVVIILQFIHISTHYTVYFKLTQYINISIKLGKNKVLRLHTELRRLSWRKMCIFDLYAEKPLFFMEHHI